MTKFPYQNHSLDSHIRNSKFITGLCLYRQLRNGQQIRELVYPEEDLTYRVLGKPDGEFLIIPLGLLTIILETSQNMSR